MLKMWGQLSLRWQSYILLIMTSVFWGSSVIVSKLAFDDTSPARFLLYRMSFATLAVLPFLVYFAYTYRKTLRRLITKVLVVETIGTTLLYSLLYYGADMTSGIHASFMITASPIFIVLAAIFILGEKQELHEWIGMGISIIGTIGLVLYPVFQGSLVNDNGSFGGNILIVFANICTALYFVLAKWWYHNENKIFASFLGFPLGMISFAVISWLEHSISSDPRRFFELVSMDLSNHQILVPSIFMALGASVIANTAYFLGQDMIEASEASLFNYLQPLVYIPLGILLLSESVHLSQVYLLAIILVGVVVAEKRFKRTSTVLKWYHKLDNYLHNQYSHELKSRQRV